MDDSAVTQPTEQPSPEGAVIPATGLALAFLTAAEKMEIMLATPTATETAAEKMEIIPEQLECGGSGSPRLEPVSRLG